MFRSESRNNRSYSKEKRNLLEFEIEINLKTNQREAGFDNTEVGCVIN